VKLKCVIINAENFKQDLALWVSVFPSSCWRAFNSWDCFPIQTLIMWKKSGTKLF